MLNRISRKSRIAFAAASAELALLQASHAFLVAGPGGGPGTASAISQLVMAIIVYGSAGCADYHRADRRVAGSEERSDDRDLAATPETVHVRNDHRAARPVFLDVGRGAIAHSVGPRIVAGIDPTLVLAIDPDPRTGAALLRR